MENDSSNAPETAAYLICGSRLYELTAGRSVTLGRVRENDIVVNDNHASRQHARIEVSPGSCVIKDLNSSNGTCVNGEKVSRHTLKTGDKIEIGAAVYLFHSGEQPPDLKKLYRHVVEDLPTARITAPGDALPPDDFGGSVEAMPLVEICQMIGFGNRSGSLQVVPPEGDAGRLYFREGRLVHAECGAETSNEAVFRILLAKCGTFRFNAGDVDVRPSITMPTSVLLLEAMRRIDENSGRAGLSETATTYPMA